MYMSLAYLFGLIEQNNDSLSLSAFCGNGCFSSVKNWSFSENIPVPWSHTSDVTSKIDDCINNLSSSAVINFEMKVQDLAI